MARQARSQQGKTPQNGNAGKNRRAARNSPREVRRRKKRRRQRIIIQRVILVVLLIAVIVLAPTIFFRVSQITVTGDTRYTADELIEASGVSNGDNMFFLDTKRIISNMEQTYPYLGTIELHRKMPSTLQIEVSDRTPVLSVEHGQGYLLLDLTGKVLEETDTAQENTAQVLGASSDGLAVGDTVDSEHEKIMAVLHLMELMNQYEMDTSIRSIDVQKAYDVRVQYEDRYTILLGSMEEDKLEHKIQFLQAILKEPSLPESGIIDLTGDSEARYRPEEESPTEDTVVFDEDIAAGEETGDGTPDNAAGDGTADTTQPEEAAPAADDGTAADNTASEDTGEAAPATDP
ncbi:MAG: FtsQ-type POTRA domain-containing protein [Eubacteriales bacterium]|nr:FtsQ-type POTRA domain-containing protein [Eubacteriales bacterium]